LFWVVEGRQQEFEAVFALSGPWPEFLAGAAGFLGTELRCESVLERQYRVVDVWTTHLAFEAFRSEFAEAYERFSEWFSGEGLVTRELLVGMYYTDDPQSGDGDDLVVH